jgi:hypothetical protein
VRKQYGVGWFMVLLLNYTFAIPVAFICSFIANLLRLRNPFKQWPKIAQLGGNVGRLWVLAPRIIRGTPYFYKVL